MEWVHELFQQYGYYVVLVGTLLEYIAFPFPGEPTLVYAGYLAYTGELQLSILLIIYWNECWDDNSVLFR
ncbi:putative membrane protein [Bacillus clarus]|uniref:Putative membrane protein n=1 Tax=Bacillus clarus TaxID=2338372 RepID=A0A090YMT7_9BACI|nr:putative membrane protein [Bacillus clarus]